MNTAIILHGMPSKEEYFDQSLPSQSNKHWIPWLQKELIVNNILAQTPELPEPYFPVYEKWCSTFEQFKIDENTILVGHSCGAGFLVRWLSENKIKVGGVALIAPFLDPSREFQTGDFFDFEIDKNILSRVGRMCIFVSTDDESYILESTRKITEGVAGIEKFEFKDKGHFTFGDMKSEEFSELLNWLIK